MRRPFRLFVPIVILGLGFVGLAVSRDGRNQTNDPSETRTLPVKLAKPAPGEPAPPLPVPMPPEPTVPLAVSVTNFPMTEGHLLTSDHADEPQAVSVRRTPQVQLVGFTEATTYPDVGVFGHTRVCQAEFPGTRMCTIDEALASLVIPDLSIPGSDAAWIRSGAPPVSPADSPGGLADDGTCSAWGSREGQGSAITRKGVVRLISCDQLASVACCAPMP